jgi:putative transposase
MRGHSKEFSLDKMAQVLNVSRSGYYQFLLKGETAREAKNKTLKEKIKSIHKKNREVYGSPRIHHELKEQGEPSFKKKGGSIDERRRNLG